MKIAPSILDADFSNLQSEVNSLDFADRIHLDIMDGKYVPRKTFHAKDISHIRFPKPIEAHLMVENPAEYFDEFQALGCQGIAIHIETQENHKTKKLLHELQSRGISAGICIDGFTGTSDISDEIMSLADQILVMSVKAGKGGQSFMTESLQKIYSLRKRGFGGEIEVDGGINLENVKFLHDAGADIVVVGSFLMRNDVSSRKKLIQAFQKV
jgi:ribulose-phosphate 3-epimerase